MQKRKKKRVSVSVLITILVWILGNGTLSGMVLCMAGPDHFGLETIHYGWHWIPPCDAEGDSHSGVNSLDGIAQGPESGPCNDIPVLSAVSNGSSAWHPDFVKPGILSVHAGDIPDDTLVNLAAETYFLISSSLIPSPLLRLKTTILLI